MGNVGKTVVSYQEYLERCIKAAARGMEMCASDPVKSAQHKATKKAYEDALQAFEKYPFFRSISPFKDQIYNLLSNSGPAKIKEAMCSLPEN